MKFLILSLLFFCLCLSTNANTPLKLKNGRWIGVLEIIGNNKLYFEMQILKHNKSFAVLVVNGEEKVTLNQPIIDGDSVRLSFTNFNSELIFKIINNTTISGRWVNHLKVNYAIPFSATFNNTGTIFPLSSSTQPMSFSGKWHALFSPEKDPFDALGVFEQKGNNASGTFLTETGDYRFLSGNVDGNTLYLSGFDGSHAYLFVGKQDEKEKISGQYMSGIHYQSNWSAERNENFELHNPDSLTKSISESHEDLTLNFKNLDNTPFEYPNSEFKDKVVIIQILGTWCSNCMDETVYFKELYNKYHDKGLEILSVGYENGAGFEDYANRLKEYQKRFDLKNTIVVGGSIRDNNILEDFSFLSNFSSYPTSIFIDRKGNIARIHTGFSGPSTGKYYNEYKEETEKLIDSLISQ